MHDVGADRQAEMLKRPRRVGGGSAEGTGFARQAGTARRDSAGDGTPLLMGEVLCREDVLAAYKRVVRNGGSPGVDGMTVEELMTYCREHWARIREELLSGRYQLVRLVRYSLIENDYTAVESARSGDATTHAPAQSIAR